MATTFYPFVENSGCSDDANIAQPSTSARIAIYDDMSMPPRVVLVEPSDIASYLSNITQTVYELVSKQCDEWPFMVIRELVENYIHAHFMEPSISITDKGRTIVFSDQGPGISNKEASRGVGFSSATPAMKRYIRGVGSGFPIVENHMKTHNGTIRIEDNLGHGTIVTVSLGSAKTNETAAQSTYVPQQQTPVAAQQPPMGGYGQECGGYWQQGAQQGGYLYGQQMPQQVYGVPAPGYQQPGYAGAYQAYRQPYGAAGTPWPQQQAQPGMYGGAQPGYGYPAGNPYGAQPQYQQQAGYPPQPAMQEFAPGYGMPQQQGQPQAHPWQAAGMAGENPNGAQQAQAGIRAHVPLTSEERDIMRVFQQAEKVGPTELNKRLSIPTATGSRKLADLARAGLITKNGQKYVLTGEGERVLSYLTNGEV